jgi:hypothetical protein
LTSVISGTATTRVRTLCIALVAVLGCLAVLLPAASEAKKKSGKAKVTVMTRNVYLGADLSPALAAPDLPSAVSGAGEIYREIERTNFPERAVPLAKEIKRAKPALVGLQEVALWRVQMPSDGGSPGTTGIGTDATEVKYDFLQELLDNLGGKYKVVTVQEEFEGELPADADDNPGTGPLFGADLDARLTMRDVILDRKGDDVKAKKNTVKQQHYSDENLYKANVGGIEVTAARGWQSVTAKYKKVKGKGKKSSASGKKGKKRKGKKVITTKFRFVNTHLEAFGDPAESKYRQGQELADEKGALNTKKAVVLVGDLNSALLNPHQVGDGGNSGIDDDQLAFKAILGAGMKDYGTKGDFTCCYGSGLMADEDPFDHTIDHILANKKAKVKKSKAYVTGNDPAEITPSGLWPSDHGGAVSKLTMKAKKKNKK